jgi:hypothetical protein
LVKFFNFLENDNEEMKKLNSHRSRNSQVLKTTKNETLINSIIIDFDSSEDIAEIDEMDSLTEKIRAYTLSNPLKNYKTLRHDRNQSIFNSKEL